MKTATAASKSGARKTVKRKKAGRGGLRGRLVRAFFLLAGLAVFAVGYLFWQVTHYTPPNPVPTREAGIVLGAALWKDVPSPGLKERLDQAVKLYHAGRVGKLIVSGGLDHNGSKLTEAQGMRLYLVSKGIPRGDILLENRSTSTYENLLYSRKIGEAAGIKSYLIITHDYHASRAGDIARFLGYPDPVVSSVKSKVLNASTNDTRETLAYGKWEMDKLLMLLGLKSTPL